MEELEKGLKELKEFTTCRKNNNINQPDTPSSQGLNHQLKSTHGGTLGSSHICSRGWPSCLSVVGKALGPLNARCPRVVECKDQETGVGRLMSRGLGLYGVFEGKPENSIIFEMQIPNNVLSAWIYRQTLYNL